MSDKLDLFVPDYAGWEIHFDERCRADGEIAVRIPPALMCAAIVQQCNQRAERNSMKLTNYQDEGRAGIWVFKKAE